MNALQLSPLLIAAWAAPVLAAETPETGTEAQARTQAAEPHAAHRGHGNRREKKLELGNTAGAKVRFWQPDLQTRDLVPRDQAVSLPRTGIAAYYAVVAEWDRPAAKEALIRYEYQNGRPTKHSPRELLAALKTDLEIVPDPLPREHYRYHANERWGFRVRFRGAPVAGATVSLSTEHGSELQADSDAAGRVSFLLPDDHPQVKPGRRANKPAEMTLRVEHSDPDRLYATRLGAVYHADPGHWQSVPWGVGVAAIGLLAGLVVSPKAGKGKREGGK